MTYGDTHTWTRPTPAWQAEYARRVSAFEAGLCYECGERYQGRANVGGNEYATCPCSPTVGRRVFTKQGDEGFGAHGELLLQSVILSGD